MTEEILLNCVTDMGGERLEEVRKFNHLGIISGKFGDIVTNLCAPCVHIDNVCYR